VLYNIEQFKGDALVLPEIKQGRKSDDESPGVYGAGAQSAGSIKGDSTSKGASKVLGNAGKTSLTGKNPFTILKASALASKTAAQFPNNFANLPKVTPPFLEPLPPSDRPIYTLVLDLDETLIHNVEVSTLHFVI
jgi:hypothetical protein